MKLDLEGVEALDLFREAGFHVEMSHFGSLEGTLQAAVRLVGLVRLRTAHQIRQQVAQRSDLTALEIAESLERRAKVGGHG